MPFPSVSDPTSTRTNTLVSRFRAAHNIEPAYTPTYSSWLNAIEAHFTSLKKFAIGGTDDPSHEYRRWRIARYLTWRNKAKGNSRAALAQFSRVRLYRL